MIIQRIIARSRKVTSSMPGRVMSEVNKLTSVSNLIDI